MMNRRVAWQWRCCNRLLPVAASVALAAGCAATSPDSLSHQLTSEIVSEVTAVALDAALGTQRTSADIDKYDREACRQLIRCESSLDKQLRLDREAASRRAALQRARVAAANAPIAAALNQVARNRAPIAAATKTDKTIATVVIGQEAATRSAPLIDQERELANALVKQSP